MDDTRGLVIQVGSSPADAAAHVARLRDWRHETVRTAEEAGHLLAAGGSHPILIALDGDDASSEALLTLAEIAARAPGDLALGFLHGFGAEALTRAASRFPTAAAVAPRDSVQRFFGMPDFASYAAGAQLQAGDLLAPADLLFLLGHGNGADAGAGDFVLCRRDTAIPARPARSTSPVRDAIDALPCFGGAPCRFDDRPVTVVRTDDLRARRIVALVCWGVSVTRHPFSIESTVGAGLLEGSQADTVLTLVRVAAIGRGDYLALYYACNDGLPLGTAATRANRARLARGQRADIICFGDPESRLQPSVVAVTADVIDRGLRLPLASIPLIPSIPSGERGKFIDVRIDASSCTRGLKAPALVIDGASPEAAVAMPDGTLYATLGPDAFTASDSLDVSAIECASLRNDAARLAPLGLDLETIRQMLLSLSQSFLASRQDLWPFVTRTAEQAADIEHVLQHWPMATIEPGAVVSGAGMTRAREDLETRLTRLRDTLLTLWEQCLDAKVPMLQVLDRPLRIVDEVAGAGTCAYCGQLVDDHLRRDVFDRWRRRSGFCRACGHIYNGRVDRTDSDSDVWVRCESPMTIGAAAPISVTVRNPYAWPCSAQFAIGLLPFGRCAASPPVRSSVEHLDDTGALTRTLHGSLEIPSNAPPGRHELFGCVIAGVSLTFVRRWVTLS
jgi:hypothetical protein